MPPAPRKRLAVVTCMDARIDAHRMLDLEEGDAHVIRNAGGLVTDDVIRSLRLSQELLGTDEIMLVMHEDCGLQGRPDGFADLEEELSRGVARLRDEGSIPRRDAVTGYVYDPKSRELRQVA